LKLISTGSRNWRTVSWANREKELVSKFGRKPGETTADRKYDPLISEYVELVESETNDPKSDDRRWNGLIRQAPASFAIRWGYVRFLAKSDRIPDAIRQAKAALAIEPGHFETRRLLAQLQFRDRQFENALNEIEIALATRHDDISALRIRSILRLYAGHREELLSEIDRMGEILNMESELTPDDPGNPVTRNETLFPKALESNEVLDTRTVERIHGMFPKDREVTTLLVKKYYNEKRFGEAIELMERIPASGPRSTQDLINLAILYRNDFRKEKAIEVGKELITREDFAVWLNKRKSIRNFYYLLLKDFEVVDPKSTLRIYRILADKMSNIITNKGLWHFQFARLNLIEFGRSGLEESINQLKFAGQQHMVYIQKWYEGDPAFDPYRDEIDASLKSFFITSPTLIPMD
jgi:tetratricopeptide (TPR) repeat protein